MKYPACNKYHIRALCPFLDFFGGNLLRLAKRDSRLAARGSGSQARKIASPMKNLYTRGLCKFDSACAPCQNWRGEAELQVHREHVGSIFGF